MSLPKWNPRWDPPDPLRGRGGWSVRHRLHLVFTVLFVLTAFACVVPGLVLTASARAREQRKLLHIMNQLRSDAEDQANGEGGERACGE